MVKQQEHLGTLIYYFIFLFIVHVHNDELNTFKRQPCLRFASMEQRKCGTFSGVVKLRRSVRIIILSLRSRKFT